jgi:hypothetical protein
MSSAVAACGRLCALIVLAIAAIVPATAGAAVTPAVSAQATANVTDATTGIADASSTVVPRKACSAPTPGQATCLAQFLALRGTRTPIHAHVRQAASPNRFVGRHAHSGGAASPLSVPAAGTPQPGTPAYLQQAYDLAYLSQNAGADQTVAVVDAYDDPTAESDLAAYRAKFSLPPCTTDNGCFQKVDKNGNPIASGTGTAPATNNAWGLEISLDLDAVSALCPKCHVLLVEANSFSPQVMAAAQQTAKNLGATAISDSWRILPASTSQQSWFENKSTFAFPGTPTVAASGDTGYLGVGSDPACNVAPFTQTPTLCNSYPAALPGVTAVGGTTLAPASGARGFGESAWVWKNPTTRDPATDGATGSGCNTFNATPPPWQTGTGCNGRAYNDISADGDPASGMLVCDTAYTSPPGTCPPDKTSGDGWLVVGGTSEAAPLVAAYYALLQSTTGQSASLSLGTPEWLYDSPAAKQLNDPVGGFNGPCDPLAPHLCTAGPGYDGPTGTGSISGAVVAGAPGIGAPGPTGGYHSGVSSTGAYLQGGVYPNGADTMSWWEYGTTNSYGQETAHTNIVSGTSPVAVSDVLTGLAPNTTYHYRLVAENNAGIEAGYDFTFTTPAAPPPTVTTTPPPPTTITPPPAPTPPPPATVPHTLPSAPSLGRLRILALGAGTATAGATIDTHGAPTTYYLAYGTTPALARRAPARSSTSAANATWNLRGLAAGRVYYLQVLAANAGGSRRTAVIRVKTSPVSLGKITMRGGKLAVVVRCHGSGACGVRLAAKAGKRLIAAGSAKIRGNHSQTALLKVNRAAVTHPSHGHKLQGTLSAVSVWNGYAAAVGANFRLALRT